jgi:electron transfer flavoprotein alpha subunit
MGFSLWRFRTSKFFPRQLSQFSSPRQALISTLAVLEQKEGKLNHGSLSAITAAKKLGGAIHGFVAGGNVGGAAEQAAKVDGVEKILVVENEAYEKVYFHADKAYPAG